MTAGEPDGFQLAVLGSPIAHSLSPALHSAAYRALNLPWAYARHEVASGGLSDYLRGLDGTWRGLSLTMPLKREVLPLLTERTPAVDASGAANTVLMTAAGLRGFNTDIPGLIGALGGHGIVTARLVHIIGTGNTAASSVIAVSALGAERVVVSGRRAESAAAIVDLAESVGLLAEARGYGTPLGQVPDVVINTLPGHVDPEDVAEADEGGALMEVPYDPWPTPRASRWLARGATVVNGRELLLHQAVEQVRIFVTGSEGAELPDEHAVIAAMRRAIDLPVAGS